jgi:hypothetical protein
MKMASISSEADKPLVFHLATRVLFEPSVFKGTGEEPRKGIVLALSQEEANDIAALEEAIRQKLEISPDKWLSSVRRHDSGISLKAKIDLTGPRASSFLHKDTGARGPPEGVKGREVDVVVLVHSSYIQKTGAGLVADVVAMKYGDVHVPAQPNWWELAGLAP